MSLSSDEKQALSILVIEKTAEGLLCVDELGKILFANDAASRTLSETSQALCGKEIFHIAPEMVPVLWKEFWKEIRSNGSFSFEFQLHASTGRHVQVDVVAQRLKPADRELACLFFHDVEERKRLLSLQQEFVTNVSHELRTPMTVIREGISQVSEGLRGEINEAQKRALSLALAGIERMGRMINDLLDMSKIESGKIALKKQRLDMTELVRDVASAFQALAEDRKIDLRVTTPAGAVTLYGDRDRLTQVLTNLVGNSFKYTEKGHIQIEIASQSNEMECSVTDTGMGIDKDSLEKIFAKFEQLGQVSFTGEKGTGLGLAISRGIVELHRGRIWAESVGQDRGTRVAFTLPRQSGRDVFVEQLSSVFHDVARRGGNLSTVVFTLSGDSLPDSSARIELLIELENLVRRHTGRMSDLVVRDANALYVALQSTVKREAERLVNGIIDSAKKELLRPHRGQGLSISYVITSFPEDAVQERAYIDKIFVEDPE